LFKSLELPLLIGISRKSIYKELNSTAKEALNGTTVLNTVALTKGKYFAGARCERSCGVCNCGIK
jgi:dihydropteroate synthase